MNGWLISTDGKQYLRKDTITDFLIDEACDKRVSIRAYSSGNSVFATVGTYYVKDLGMNGALTAAKEDLWRFLSLPEMNVGGAEEQTEEASTDSQQEIEYENEPIEELDLSVRAYNCLIRAGIKTIGDLTEKSTSEILAIRNLGKKSAAEVKAKLAIYIAEKVDVAK